MILFPPVRGGARSFQVIDSMLELNLCLSEGEENQKILHSYPSD